LKEPKSIVKLISCVHRLTACHVHSRLEKYGVGSSQVFFLMRLYHGDRISQDQMASELLVDKATCTRAIKKLERAGFVMRVVDAADRRVHRIHLTKKAKKLRPIIEKISEDWTSLLLTGFSEEEREKLSEFLERLVTNATVKREGCGGHV